MNKLSEEETDNPLLADDRNYHKVEKWTKPATKPKITFLLWTIDILFAQVWKSGRQSRLLAGVFCRSES
jgi:hypothetical protein